MSYHEPLPSEVNEYLDICHIGHNGTMLKVSEHLPLCTLTTFVDYQSERWGAIRKRVDELDQVTVWPRDNNAIQLKAAYEQRMVERYAEWDRLRAERSNSIETT